MLLPAGCNKKGEASELTPSDVPDLVTDDIKAGIEQHIAGNSTGKGGFYHLNYEGRELRLKLVKVHIEYLANLGPAYHFACVDLADTDGEVYDVDFFMKGEPGAMAVTETTIHKVNGQPLYAWEQQEDKSWHRVEADAASAALFGVKKEPDKFEFLYQAKLPKIDGSAKMWIPLPVNSEHQQVEIVSISAVGSPQVLYEQEHGNKVLFLLLAPEHSGETVEIRIRAQRKEKSAYADHPSAAARFLLADSKVPLSDEFKEISAKVLEGKQGELVRARALYDHVIDRMAYKKTGQGWGEGDAVYACDTKTGNCTDFHSYFIAVARAAGIPARFAIGAAIPSARDEGGISGYHCWAEFYAEGKWWPVDISEGDKYSGLATYYFGHHPANRLELSRGRDLVFEPGPASGPVNFFAYPVLEIEGDLIRLKPRFSFKRIS